MSPRPRHFLFAAFAALPVLLLAGCQASLDAANPAPPAAQAPDPAAGLPPGWTTPPNPQLPRLRRSVAPGASRERGTGKSDEEWALASSPGDPAGVDTALERRLELIQTAGPWEIYPTTWTQFRFGGDLHTGENGVSVWDNRVRVSFEKPTDYSGRYSFNLQYDLTKYFFSGSNSFVAGTNEPFGLVHTVNFGANAFQPVHEKWAVVLSGAVGMSAASGASLSDGLSWSVTAGAGHRYSKKLDIGAGVIVGRRFAEDVYVFGGPQFDWRPTDKWRIALAGASLDISYRPNSDWEWGVNGGFASGRFRLRDEAPQLGRIVTDTRLPIYLRLRYRGSKKVDVELRAGADFLHQWIIEDRNGENGVGYDGDIAPFVGLRWIQRL